MPDEIKKDVKPVEKKPEPANTRPEVDVDPIQVAVNNTGNLADSIKLFIVEVANRFLLAKDNSDEVEKEAARLKERQASYSDAILNNTQYAPIAENKTESKPEPVKK